MQQLYRRISTYIKINERSIEIYDDGLDGSGYPKGQPVTHYNEVNIIKITQPKKKCIVSDLFEKYEFNDDDLPF